MANSGYHQTPLHTCKNSEIAELLINAGADLSIKNKGGQTPYESHAFAECIARISSPSGDSQEQEIIEVIEEAMQSQDIFYDHYVCKY